MAENAWDDPVSGLEQHRAIMDRRNEVAAAEKAEVLRYNALFEKAIGRVPIPALLDLGPELKRRGHDFWLAYYEVDQRRIYEIKGNPPPSTGTLIELLVIKIIKSACIGDRDELVRLFEHARKTNFSLGHALEAMLERIKVWGDSDHRPPTPHMTRAELVAALKGTPKMSDTTVWRWLRDRKMDAIDQIRSFARFKHRSAETHLVILRAVVAYLKSK